MNFRSESDGVAEHIVPATPIHFKVCLLGLMEVGKTYVQFLQMNLLQGHCLQ